MQCTSTHSLAWVSRETAVDFIICISVSVTDVDGSVCVATEEEEEVDIYSCILALICSIECIGGVECSDINHSKLVARDLSRDVEASNEEITTNSCIIIVVDIIGEEEWKYGSFEGVSDG